MERQSNGENASCCRSGKCDFPASIEISKLRPKMKQLRYRSLLPATTGSCAVNIGRLRGRGPATFLQQESVVGRSCQQASLIIHSCPDGNAGVRRTLPGAAAVSALEDAVRVASRCQQTLRARR